LVATHGAVFQYHRDRQCRHVLLPAASRQTTSPPVDAKTVTWQSKDQTLNGKPLPDTKGIKMKRAE
jgi:hypothetical protein